MWIKVINRLCYALAMLCVVAGVAIGLAMVWQPGNLDTLWKSLVSVLILFGGALAILSVNSVVLSLILKEIDTRSED
ncbi:MAG: hypothetical protein AAF916_02120 [Planctomycetota bacterium]